MNKFDIYPNKSLFSNDENVELNIMTEKYPLDIEIHVTHLRKAIYRKHVTIEKPMTKLVLTSFPNNASYGVECMVHGQVYTTSFETYDSWKQVPRYGFLCDFSTKDLEKKAFIETLLKLHINVVQYYDWMYRHNDLISPTSEFVDLMGRKLDQNVVKSRIEICKKANIANIAYGAIYAAAKDFYESHKDWALYNHNGEPITFIDIFTIMNFTQNSGWQKHIINEYQKAIEKMGFDGIHMDTYGYPKVARDYQGNTVRLDDHFSALIEAAKKQLEENNLSSELIFNNVGGWPIEKTCHAPQSALYIEIWDPISSYEDIVTLIRKVNDLNHEKQLIISAYLKPYYEPDSEAALIAHKLLHAVIAAAGAQHLIMGEAQKVLRTGYYCDNGILNDTHFEEIRKYYDFNAEFSEILYDKSLTDVSLTHAFGDNIEYVFADKTIDVHAKAKSVYAIMKENDDFNIIHLINLTNQTTTLWNHPHEKPQTIHNLQIQLLMVEDVEEVLLVSPDTKDTSVIEYELENTDRGMQISFNIPRLEIWDMLIIRKKKKRET